jgi:hypothetical protein
VKSRVSLSIAIVATNAGRRDAAVIREPIGEVLFFSDWRRDVVGRAVPDASFRCGDHHGRASDALATGLPGQGRDKVVQQLKAIRFFC